MVNYERLKLQGKLGGRMDLITIKIYMWPDQVEWANVSPVQDGVQNEFVLDMVVQRVSDSENPM